jgi:hypothetical protein
MAVRLVPEAVVVEKLSVPKILYFKFSHCKLVFIYLQALKKIPMRYLLLMSFCLFMACSSSKKVSELTKEDIKIVMEKEGCFGTCPAYTFIVYTNGYCEFIGKKDTNKPGKHSVQLTKEKYKEIVQEFKNSGFFTFKDYYESKIPDLPTITISFTDKKLTKTIAGKRERPEEIHRLQFMLEQIAEALEGWIQLEGPIEDNTPKIDNSKIVLKLKNGAQLSRWFNFARQNYGIRILKQLDGANDIWVVSYNMNEYTPAKILDILKKDSNIESAEFQTMTSEK